MLIKTVKTISRFPASMLPHCIDKNEDNDETLCTFLDENDCRFYYVYYFDNVKKEVIKAQKKLECPPKSENSIYKQATSTFKNPTYARKG